jgi:hypothetical protein
MKETAKELAECDFDREQFACKSGSIEDNWRVTNYAVFLIRGFSCKQSYKINWIFVPPAKNMFSSVIAGAFQITFHVKMHVNHLLSKRSKTYKLY